MSIKLQTHAGFRAILLVWPDMFATSLLFVFQANHAGQFTCKFTMIYSLYLEVRTGAR
jgi:hypothetical protein